MTDKPRRTTTDAGIPVASDEFSLTVGPDPDEAVAWTLTMPPARVTDLSKLRVAVMLEDPNFGVDTEVQERIQALESVLELPEAGGKAELPGIHALRSFDWIRLEVPGKEAPRQNEPNGADVGVPGRQVTGDDAEPLRRTTMGDRHADQGGHAGEDREEVAVR